MTTLVAHSHDPPSPDAKVQRDAPSLEPVALILRTTTLLFATGEPRERPATGGNRIAKVWGSRATLTPGWDELIVRLEGSAGPQHDVAQVEPAGIDMNKVLATEQTVDA